MAEDVEGLQADAARLLIRCLLALSEEGIGPSGDATVEDDAVIAAAVALVGDEFGQHTLWDAGLVLDNEHPPCDQCRWRTEGGDGG